MKACFIERFGGIDAISAGELDQPRPQADEVVIATRSAALNHLDIWVRKGRPDNNLPLPHVLGSDASGVVYEVGSNVSDLKEGDEVLVNPGLSCGSCRACRKGQHSECANYGILGLSRPGTFAQYFCVPARNVYRKPAYMTFADAAAFPLTYLTAWRMVVSKGCVKPGQRVLIHGIGGGVAQAALVFATLAGAETFVTSSSEEKLLKAGQMGANHVISYTRENVVERVMGITNGQGIDLIIDAVGAKTMPSNLELVRKGGAIVLCGVTSGATVEMNLQAVYWKQLRLLGSTMGSDEDFRQMYDAVCVNNLKPMIDSLYPLDKIHDATKKMEDGEQFGKLVLTVE